jgi:hypothetical protein
MEKRIFSLDVIKGIAVLGVVIFHRILFDYSVTYKIANEGLEAEAWQYALFAVFGIFLSMAGIFYLLSGTVNSYSFSKRLSSKDKNYYYPASKLLAATTIAAIFYMIVHYLYAMLLGSGFGETGFTGLIPGLFMTGEVLPKGINQIIRTTTLSMVAITVFVVPIVVALLVRGEGQEKVKRNYIVLFLLGTAFIFLSIFLRPPVAAMIDIAKADLEQAVTQNNIIAIVLNILLAIIYALLVRNQAPIFPFLGYGFYGAIIGIALFRQEDKRKIRNYLLAFGIISFIIGGFSFMVDTGLNPAQLTGYTFEEALQYALLRFQELSIFAFLILAGLFLIDYQPEEKKMMRVQQTTILRRFGMMSLTVYALEGVLAGFVRFIIDLFLKEFGWRDNILFILGYIAILVILWHVILIFWERKNYVGSLEWFTTHFVKLLSGKKSNKLDIQYLKSKTL